MKKLYRNTTKGKVAGVCYGLAYYFGIDVAFVRAAFLMFALFGWGVPAYIAFWIVMPKLKTRNNR